MQNNQKVKNSFEKKVKASKLGVCGTVPFELGKPLGRVTSAYPSARTKGTIAILLCLITKPALSYCSWQRIINKSAVTQVGF